MKDEIALIGDIHGMMAPLVKIVPRALSEAREVVFLGDYINRGSESRNVVDLLIDLRKLWGSRISLLRGHHDAAFLRALDEGDVDGFLRMGGAATLINYPRLGDRGDFLALQERVPLVHLEFFRSLEDAFISDEVIATHDKRDAQRFDTSRYGIFGHNVRPNGEPLVTARYALIDTGCGTVSEGRLTCLFWPSLRWIQAS